MIARFQSIYDIANLCAKKGLTQAVLCPGSRCAPLTLAFTRHPNIQCRTISDERSAAFIALGISQQLKQPAILLCTSGTAACNFSPAVAEAYFSKRPLVVFTADRPTEWIGQQDGQTIFQTDVFGKHVKKSYQLPQEYEHQDNVWAITRMVNEAINFSRQEPQGPVHINVPFREPLYPAANEQVFFSDAIRVMEDNASPGTLDDSQKKLISDAWFQFHNVLLVAGQLDFDEPITHSLNRFFSIHNVPIVGDIISNLHPIEKTVRHADLFLGQCPEEILKTLKPDLLITFGDSTISKNLKLFLRKYKPAEHWHIQHAGFVADTFQSITKIIRTSPVHFFDFLSSIPQQNNFETQKQNNYNKLWEVEERRACRVLNEYFPCDDLGELELVKEIIGNVPPGSNLHVANSMSVRYANFIGLTSHQHTIKVFANRGTSGIDGCTSTSIGHSLTSNIPNVLVTGDLAFFYDRNAFWHNYALPHFRALVLNNHGGIIFKMIDGPGDVPEAKEYFITDQRLNAKNLCNEFGIEYLKVDNRRKLKNVVRDFFEFDGKPKLLELESDLMMNKKIFDNLKQKIRKSYEL
ncbi:2-succinyl-5-enolpyruvyl-6-hydroxy-3-cyclohexene-1-carboxylic-acid synthase [Chryseolinea sp. H1M3-3]|uniref:2-succinyl-5-enolpyruvyl-6-hydroxy-3- cyclohexene-1-carboxylic-acid synthase n=1 Tax=Chryseolinea sp. H1M3-3 TaxID=3034144 RepID=UPI0023EAA951|nr:2-succinyl-5-enolpyruvyl-6-hydroxy-3-cyclohexene-1-carboxylic-acid synthase [Chryseolinea sp. H1M3-3]